MIEPAAPPPLPPTTAPARPHIVHIDRRGAFSSPTLDEKHLEHLHEIYAAGPWYSDKLTRDEFRRAALDTRTAAPGGVVLIGPGMSFEAPQPFDELFEPIAMTAGLHLGKPDAQLAAISGESRTRHEQIGRFALYSLGVLAFIGAVILCVNIVMQRTIRVPLVIISAMGGGLLLTLVAVWLARVGARWYFVPGGVAIVRRFGRHDRRLTLVTPRDAAAAIRYVTNGKVTSLALEIWTAQRRWQTTITDREAIAFLATWRSVQRPPPEQSLRELLS